MKPMTGCEHAGQNLSMCRRNDSSRKDSWISRRSWESPLSPSMKRIASVCGGTISAPESRKLSVLRDALPGIPIRAYTATATENVRRDSFEQLRLDRPEILVGNFDRPKLIYR